MSSAQPNQQYAYGFNPQSKMGNPAEPHHVVIIQQNPNMNAQYPGANTATQVVRDKRDYASERLVDASFTTRIQFIRKVYVLLAIQLLITTGICALSVTTIYPGGFGNFQIRNQWLLYVAIVLQIFLMLLIFCVRKVARTVPSNYIFLFVFTLVEAYLISAICAVASRNGNTSWVIISAAMTVGVTIGLSIYARFAKTDFTMMYGFLAVLPWILLILCLSIWAFPFGVLSSVLNAVFALIYCWFLIYDTQLVMGGKRHELDIDDYILGVVILYIDIVGLFLSILGAGANRN